MFNNLPLVTKNILLINIIIHLVLLVNVSVGDGTWPFLMSAHYFNVPTFKPFQIVTHMFTHSMDNIFHIVFNMLMLISFGPILERIWGAKRFFIFYVSCGIGALILYNGMGMIAVNEVKNALIAEGYNIKIVNEFVKNNAYPNVFLTSNSKALIEEYGGYAFSSMAGASGAIFGIMAAFAILFPNTQLQLLFPPIPVKAKYLIGIYFAYELYMSFFSHRVTNVAHLAHVGGAIVGAIFVLYWRKKDRTNFY